MNLSVRLEFYAKEIGKIASLINSLRPAGDTLCEESW